MEQTVSFEKLVMALIMAECRVMRASGLCFLILLTACSTAPVQREVAYSRSASQHLYFLEPWSLEGRLALTGANDTWSATINWEHLPESEDIKLSGPLGQGAVAIHLTEDFVTVARGDDAIESSHQPEQFINQQLGLIVPVRSLRYWVVGLPMPDQAFEDIVGGFKQAGWLVNYQEMQPVYGQSMPRKLTVKNDQVKLKLYIDQWIINDR